MSDNTDLMIGRVGAARAILEARRTGALLDTLATNDLPRSLEEGYAIQRAVTARWPGKIAGWKGGATSEEVQALLEISEPVYGPNSKIRCSKAQPRSRPGTFDTGCLNPSPFLGSGKTCPAGKHVTAAVKSLTRWTPCSPASKSYVHASHHSQVIMFLRWLRTFAQMVGPYYARCVRIGGTLICLLNP